MNIRKDGASVFLTIIFISFLLNISIIANTYGLEHSGTISSDETWHAADNPHVITGGITVSSPNLSSKVTLTIEPGCVVKFDAGTYLALGVGNSNDNLGALNAQGTSNKPIVFTSNASSPAPGDWGAIFFYGGLNNTGSMMDYCKVEYGGYDGWAGNINCNNASPTIKRSIIQKGSNAGIYTSGSSSPIISCSNINNNNIGVNTTFSSNPSITGGVMPADLLVLVQGRVML